jgi:tRNA G18 (ribose-2'-O)-methylase SpoU
VSIPGFRLSQLSRAKFLRALYDVVAEIESSESSETFARLKELLIAAGEHADQDIRGLCRLTEKIRPEMTKDALLALVVPIERKFGRSLLDHDFMVTSLDKTEPARIHPLTIVADNIRSAFNIGAILRTADCLGAKEVVFTGYTATPEVERVQKTAMGADLAVRWRWVPHISQIMDELEHQNVPLVALETLAEGNHSLFEFKFPPACAIILGNERHGLNLEIIARCEHRVTIPVFGIKNSMNVGIALGVCGYEIIRQWSSSP